MGSQYSWRPPPPHVTARSRRSGQACHRQPKSKAFTAADWSPARDSLWHYLPDYDYRPDLFVYAEFHTTDPDYVVVGVGDVVHDPITPTI